MKMLSGDSRTDPPQQPVTMNPFDAVIKPSSQTNAGAQHATGPTATMHATGASSTDAAALTALNFPETEGAFPNTTPALGQPISPSRLSHPSSVNNSPVPTRRQGNVTAGMSSPIPIDYNRGSFPEMPGLKDTEGLFLGLQQLERQQAELERRRQVQPSESSTPTTRSPAQRRLPPSDEQQHDAMQTPVQSFPDPAAPSAGDAFVDDDENTEPSSSGAGSENREGVMITSQGTQHQNATTFGRMIQNTKVGRCGLLPCRLVLY